MMTRVHLHKKYKFIFFKKKTKKKQKKRKRKLAGKGWPNHPQRPPGVARGHP
jgi:hypothetical protein